MITEKVITQYITSIPHEHQKYFKNIFNLDLEEKIQLALNFKLLNLKKEKTYLYYTYENEVIIITDKNIHSKNNIYRYEEFTDVYKAPFNINENHFNYIKSFLSSIKKNDIDFSIVTNTFQNISDSIYNLITKKSDSLEKKVESFTNEKNTQKMEKKIPIQFNKPLIQLTQKLEILKTNVNKNPNLKTTFDKLIAHKQIPQINSFELIMICDLIHLYNKILNSNTEIIVKDINDLLLVYFTEKLQNKHISYEEIGELFQTQSIKDYISELTQLNIVSNNENSFILYDVLQLNDKELQEQYTQFFEELSYLITNQKIELFENLEKNEDTQTLEEVLKEMDLLIGLNNVKESVRNFSDFLKVQKIREEKGYKTINNSLHSVFFGPPGTGKTTIARILAKVYHKLGYLKKGHLIETDRSGLVAGYVGQTAIKTDEVITKALDGVLFIDEAYSLMNDNSNDFGKESIEILLKRMEDFRSNLVIIVAGYNEEMKEFIKSNPGLQSRFNRFFFFEHFTPTELMSIFELNCTQNDFILSEDAKDKLSIIIDKLYETKHEGFGNARVMRNIFEKVTELQARRIIKLQNISDEQLKTIEEEDIPEINPLVEEIQSFTILNKEEENKNIMKEIKENFDLNNHENEEE